MPQAGSERRSGSGPLGVVDVPTGAEPARRMRAARVDARRSGGRRSLVPLVTFSATLAVPWDLLIPNSERKAGAISTVAW